MRNIFAALIFGALSVAPLGAVAQKVDAPSGAYKIDPTHASVIWSVRHMGLSNYTARFEKFDATLMLDVENPENSRVEATVDPLSVSTGFPGETDFNAEIATDGKFLNSAPISFVSTHIEMTGERTAKIFGDLTLLGETREIELDAELIGAMAQHPFAQKPAVGFHATGVIDRTEFGMDYLAPDIVSGEVHLEINAEFVAEG